jgi:uncharacterized membrane protein
LPSQLDHQTAYDMRSTFAALHQAGSTVTSKSQK